jgi:alpha-glucosidase
MLTLYRRALALRRSHPGFAFRGGLRWREAPAGILDFERGHGLRCVSNLSSAGFAVSGRVLLASCELEGEVLAPDSCVWVE